MLVGGRGCTEFLGYGRAAIRPVADAVFLPSPHHVLACCRPTTRPGRRAGALVGLRLTGGRGRARAWPAGRRRRGPWLAGRCVCARAGKGGRTVDNRRLKSVEISKDMVIFFHDRLTASHIECLEFRMVNLFAVGVVFKEGDHNGSDIVAQVLAVFLRRFLRFLQESEFSVRQIFCAACRILRDSLYHQFYALPPPPAVDLHYGIQQAAQ
jgi:hypothetical protein